MGHSTLISKELGWPLSMASSSDSGRYDEPDGVRRVALRLPSSRSEAILERLENAAAKLRTRKFSYPGYSEISRFCDERISPREFSDPTSPCLEFLNRRRDSRGKSLPWQPGCVSVIINQERAACMSIRHHPIRAVTDHHETILTNYRRTSSLAGYQMTGTFQGRRVLQRKKPRVLVIGLASGRWGRATL